MYSATKRATLLAPVLLLFALTVAAEAQRGIVSADYGAGHRRQNVTGRVQSMVQNGLLNFRVGNDTLGGDPAPGQTKELRLKVREWNGRTQDMRFREGQSVYLQVGATPGVAADRPEEIQDGAAASGAIAVFWLQSGNENSIATTRAGWNISAATIGARSRAWSAACATSW